jgi:hypothetical protein
MNVSDIDLNIMPIPHNIMNIPVNIGFLVYAYGPVVTNLGGGLTGTGVPLTFRKWIIDQPVTNEPTKRTGVAMQKLVGIVIILESPNHLSKARAAIMNRVVIKPKITAPTGVSSVLPRFVPVANL